MDSFKGSSIKYTSVDHGEVEAYVKANYIAPREVINEVTPPAEHDGWTSEQYIPCTYLIVVLVDDNGRSRNIYEHITTDVITKII